MFLLYWGLHIWMQYSRWGLTSTEQRGRITPSPCWPCCFGYSPGYGWLSVLQGSIAFHVQLASHHNPQVFFSRAALNPSTSQPVLMVGVATTPGARSYTFCFVEPHEVHLGPLLSLSRSLWMASHPSVVSTTLHSLVSSANLLRVHLTQLSMSLMKILKSTGPSSDHCGMPLVTDLHPDMKPLTTTLWTRSCSQLFIH